MTDFELIEEFKRGRIEGFNELVRRYQEKVYWIARRIVGSHDAADDVVQDVFIRVYESLGRFRAEANFFTWLYRIAMNMSLNALRKQRIRELVPYDDALAEVLPGEYHADAPLQSEEYETILERAIARLPAKQKLVFKMRYYDEISYEEMAKILGKSVGGLKANYFHAVKKIQQYVRKEMAS